MTIFGPDISSYEEGLILSALGSASFVIAKTTEGTYYTDRDYQGWRQQAGSLGKPFVWYHFLSGEDVHAQAAHTAANVGDRSLPGMLDVEPTATYRPTLAQAIAYADAAAAVGLRLRLVYLPHWYWEELGSPSLAALAARGLSLVSSSYPGGTGSPAGLYPGDGAGGWQAYGGMTPLIYQYTDKASDGGQSMDYNAFRGSVAQLLAALGAGSTPTTAGDIDMTPDESSQLLNTYAGVFRGGPSCGRPIPVAAGNFGAGANGMFAHLDYMTSLLEGLSGRPVPTVDPAALAAALGPLLHPTTDVPALVAALMPHLPAQPDPAAFATALISHIQVTP